MWLATSDEVLGATGGFYEQRAEIDCQFRNANAEERLWALSREMVDSPAIPVSVD